MTIKKKTVLLKLCPTIAMSRVFPVSTCRLLLPTRGIARECLRVSQVVQTLSGRVGEVKRSD